MPTSHGTLRPLGLPPLEDKSVAQAGARRREASDAQDVGAVSYGCRPGRSPPHALHEGGQGRRTNGLGSGIAWDISACCDKVPHDTRRTLLCTRRKDGRVLERLALWLQAGLLDGKARGCPEQGRPPGSGRAPLLANVYVHAVQEPGCETVVQAHGRGTGVLARDADDVVMGCEREADARRSSAV